MPDHPPGSAAAFRAFAANIKIAIGIVQARSCSLKVLLKSGCLDGKTVQVRNKNNEVLLHGTIVEHGLISCACKLCKGKAWSCSSFEAHSGSTAHRPAEFIFLSEFGRSLKVPWETDLIALVSAEDLDVHDETCGTCKEGGDLLCCGSCPRAYHAQCVGLSAAPPSEWFCKDCVLAQVAAAEAAAAATAARYKPNKLKRGPMASMSKGPGRPPKRLRMSAPQIRGQHRRNKGNGSRNKLLFTRSNGALQDGMRVRYVMHGNTLMEGTVVIGRTADDVSGILCDCCSAVISCSSFEAHAGYANRRAPYDNILTPDGTSLRVLADAMAGVADAQLDAPIDDGYMGGCCLCGLQDFLKDEFGERTMLICDACEKEYHVGCLKQAGMEELHELPSAEWFCCDDCRRVHGVLSSQVAKGDVPLSGEHSWQVLRGPDGSEETASILRTAHELLQESFDPIIDVVNGVDLMPLMIYCQSYRDWDYCGCHTLLLRHAGEPVAAATMRCFGAHLAELPLIATKLTARRQGHARVLMDAFEALLELAGVRQLSLPAAHATTDTWIEGFGFEHMPLEQILIARSQLRLLIFPETEVLRKFLLGNTAETADLKPRELPLAPPAAEEEGKEEDKGSPLEQLLAAAAEEETKLASKETSPAPPIKWQEEEANGSAASAHTVSPQVARRPATRSSNQGV